GLAKGERSGQIADHGLALRELSKDGATCRVGQRSKRVIQLFHDVLYITDVLYSKIVIFKQNLAFGVLLGETVSAREISLRCSTPPPSAILRSPQPCSAPRVGSSIVAPIAASSRRG